MDFNVVIKFDKRADELLCNVIDALTGNREEIPKAKQSVKKVESARDVDMVEDAGNESDITEEVKDIDYDDIRGKAKKLSIKLVQKKKGAELKELINEFGISKVTNVEDDKVEALYARLLELEAA